jgi:hypothetical protein
MLKHGAVKIAAVTGTVIVAMGVVEGGGSGLARCSGALEGLSLASSEGIDLLGGVGRLLLGLGSLSRGRVGNGLALLALGLGSLRMLPLFFSGGGGGLWGERRVLAMEVEQPKGGLAQASGQRKGKNPDRIPDSCTMKAIWQGFQGL